MVALLLILDAIWFFLAHGMIPATGDQKSIDRETPAGAVNQIRGPSFDAVVARKTVAWAANNFLFGICLILVASIGHAKSTETSFCLLVVFAILALLNCAIDIGTQFPFYFPSVERARLIFLGAPFTDRLDFKSKVWKDQALRELIEAVYEDLTKSGYHVYSAHIIEQWGKKRRTPARALREDLAALASSEVFVCLIDSKWSPGVQMELGAAAATKKKIIQVGQLAADWPYLNKAVSDVLTDAQDVKYEGIDDCVLGIHTEVVNVLPQRSSVRGRLLHRFGILRR